MRRIHALLAAVSLAAFAGCATVNTVDLGDGRKNLEVSNTCWRFFMMPIASGNPDNPNGHDCNWFRNCATLSNQVKMLDAEAANLNAKRVYDVRTLTTDEDFFLFVLLRENIHTSATVE